MPDHGRHPGGVWIVRRAHAQHHVKPVALQQVQQLGRAGHADFQLNVGIEMTESRQHPRQQGLGEILHQSDPYWSNQRVTG